MFRWVSCQLDYLCELPMDKDRREALEKLPPTLNATYERILLRYTHPSIVHIIRMTLMLVAAVGPQISIPALCEAVSLRDTSATVEIDDLVIEEDIIRYCSSLLRLSPDKQHFEFAHFSVSEYLQSPLVANSALAVYHISPDNTVGVIDMCLRFLLLDDFAVDFKSSADASQHLQRIVDKHPFFAFASAHWPFLEPRFLRAVDDTSAETSAGDNTSSASKAHRRALLLFNPDKQANFQMWSMALIVEVAHLFDITNTAIAKSRTEMVIDGTFTPIHMACTLTLPVLLESLVDESEGSSYSMSSLLPSDCVFIELTGPG
ncbi:hypothetical protein BJX64DRAFT_33022 [Aspergillus heterothallicus]